MIQWEKRVSPVLPVTQGVMCGNRGSELRKPVTVNLEIFLRDFSVDNLRALLESVTHEYPRNSESESGAGRAHGFIDFYLGTFLWTEGLEIFPDPSLILSPFDVILDQRRFLLRFCTPPSRLWAFASASAWLARVGG